jgi:hypothetical protein
MAEQSQATWGGTLLRMAGVAGAATVAIIVAPSVLDSVGSMLAPAAGAPAASTVTGNIGEALKAASSSLSAAPTPQSMGGLSYHVANVFFGDPVTTAQLHNAFSSGLGGRAIEGISTGASTLWKHASSNLGATAAIAGAGVAAGYLTRDTEARQRPVVGPHTAALNGAVSRPGLGSVTNRMNFSVPEYIYRR